MAYYSPFKIRMASHAMHEGQLIAYPTEAVYGLGCDPLNESAVLDLLALKQRPIEKGLIIVASDFAQLLPFILPNRQMLKCMRPTWPGPVTWVVPARPWVPMYLRGQHDSLAVRVSAHPVVQQLCASYGRAIVSTSANINKQKPACTALAVRAGLASKALFILPQDATPQHIQATTIYDAQTGACLRP